MSAHRLLALALALAAASPAAAQAPDPTARRLYAAGLEAYDAGRYDVAIRAFETAYARAPAQLLVFDLAQAHRKKFIAEGDTASRDKAIELYRKFLASRAGGRERVMAGEALGELLVIAARRDRDSAPPGAASSGAASPGAALPGAASPGAETANAPPASARTEIMVVSDARGAAVALDDRAPSPAPLLDTVEPGEHRARVSAPGYVAAEVRVTAVEGRFVVSEARLQPLPGALALSGRKGAQVEIDAQPAGVLPLAAVSLPAGTHRVSLSLRGYEPWAQDVNVERGAALTLRSQQVPTPRRRAVRWLGVAASVVGAAAIGSGVVWATSDAEASALYRRDQVGQLTLAERNDYYSARSRRDQALVGTSVTLAAGGALALTAVALYFFDRR